MSHFNSEDISNTQSIFFRLSFTLVCVIRIERRIENQKKEGMTWLLVQPLKVSCRKAILKIFGGKQLSWSLFNKFYIQLTILLSRDSGTDVFL